MSTVKILQEALNEEFRGHHNEEDAALLLDALVKKGLCFGTPIWRPISEVPLNRKWWIVWDDGVAAPECVYCRSSDGEFYSGDWDHKLENVSHFLDVDHP